MHFYGMREAPAIPLRDRGLSGCGRLTGREQLVTAAGQLAQTEFDHQSHVARGRRGGVKICAELARRRRLGFACMGR